MFLMEALVAVMCLWCLCGTLTMFFWVAIEIVLAIHSQYLLVLAWVNVSKDRTSSVAQVSSLYVLKSLYVKKVVDLPLNCS